MTAVRGWYGCTAQVRVSRWTCCSPAPGGSETSWASTSPCRFSRATAHAARRGRQYPNMDPLANVAGMMRVVSEVRALVRWLRPQSTAVAVSGVSMGSPVAALVSHLEDIDGVAVFTPILGLNAMIAQHLGRWGPSVDDTIGLLGSETVAAIASVVDHTAVEPTPPTERRLIVGAWHDRMTMRETAQSLHERWGGQLVLAPGQPRGHLFAPGVQRASEAFLRSVSELADNRSRE